MPKQVFTSPHKKPSSMSDSSTGSWPVLKTVKGLRWGAFTGSPQLSKPKKISSMKQFEGKITRLVLINDTNFFYGLPEKCHLMQATKHQNQDLVLWNECDGIVRVKSLKDKNGKTRKLFHIPMNDPVTTCGCHVKYSSLWFGHESGNISVYVRADEQTVVRPQKKPQRPFNDTLEAIIGIKEVNAANDDDEPLIETRWNFPIVLVKHRGEVLSMKVCVEFKIVVSIGSDGRAVIWDALKIEYIRTIEPSCNTLKSQLTHVEVSPTLGDILTVFSPRNGIDVASDEESFEVTDGDDFINVSMAIAEKSQLRLHTINAKYINHTFANGFATAACFSFIKEGTGVNVIAVGFDDGTIRMYSTWTLEMIREIATGANCEITQIMFATHHHLTCLAGQEIQIWESDGLSGETPKFSSIVLF
jgi:lysosomal-trafficking regulator